jgi:hypothetical protein
MRTLNHLYEEIFMSKNWGSWFQLPQTKDTCEWPSWNKSGSHIKHSCDRNPSLYLNCHLVKTP